MELKGDPEQTVVDKLLSFRVANNVTYRSASKKRGRKGRRTADTRGAPHRSADLSDYEKERARNIEENNAKLAALGLLNPALSAPERAPPRLRVPRVVGQEPTRRSVRTRHEVSHFEPAKEIPDRPRRHQKRVLHQNRSCPTLDGYTDFEGCSARSRLRHKLSHAKQVSDIDKTLLDRTLERLGGSLPLRADGTYQYVAYITATNGTWHFRSTFGRGDFGTFCDPELAAFVSNYGRLHPSKTREEVWAEIGIVDIDSINDCHESDGGSSTTADTHPVDMPMRDVDSASEGSPEEGTTLFEHVIQMGGAKRRGCTRAGVPADPDPVNCGRDGYLMAKCITESSLTSAANGSTVQQMRMSSHDVTGSDGKTYRMESLLMGAPGAEDRFQKLNRMVLADGSSLAMEAFVDNLCIIDPDVTPPYGINFSSFGKELANWTDWFYAEEGKGSLFLRYVTPSDAKSKHLPMMEGPAGGAFLYVILVCAGKGTGVGKSLVEVAERFAILLGLNCVVLSALPHVASYYWKLGYKFINQMGVAIDETPWLGMDENRRQRLYPARKVQLAPHYSPPSSVVSSNASDARSERRIIFTPEHTPPSSVVTSNASIARSERRLLR